MLHDIFPDVENGYFVDVGSADGEWLSNTKALEQRGWTGICIDPFPTTMENRTCRMFKEVVYSTAGERVQFRNAGMIGGIDDHVGRLKGQVAGSGMVEFKTTTLDDILRRANAPEFIHYLTLDIEGAELEALKGLSFDEYRIGALTIEHNYEQPKREQIRLLLESKGYRLERSVLHDDWYVLNEPGR